MGSRSMRAGINWLVLGFCIVGTDTLIDLVDRIGVERLTEGLLRAAGLMSTMASRVASQSLRACDSWGCGWSTATRVPFRAVACGQQHRRDAKG